MWIVVPNKKNNLLIGVTLIILSGISSASVEVDLDVTYIKNNFVIHEKKPRQRVVGHQSQKLKTLPFTNSTHIDPSLLKLVFQKPSKAVDEDGISTKDNLVPAFMADRKSCPAIKSDEEKVTLCLLSDQSEFSEKQLAAVVASADYSAAYDVRMLTQALGTRPVHNVEVLSQQLKKSLNDKNSPEGNIYFDYDHDAHCKKECKTVTVIFISPLK